MIFIVSCIVAAFVFGAVLVVGAPIWGAFGFALVTFFVSTNGIHAA